MGWLGSTPSYKVSLMPEWEAKMEAIIDETLNEKVTSLWSSFMDVSLT